MLSGITKEGWLFAIKTTIAALIALYISLAFNLDNPGWAVTTVFVSSQPFSSSTLSKGWYRFLGTILGATGALILVPNLIQTPEILCIALALWTAICLYISLQDRSPRSYIFMLAGYSISFIAFPSVSTPENIFNICISRVQEILIGVIVSGIIHNIIFPNNIFNAVKHTIDKWLVDAYQLIGDTLEHNSKPSRLNYEILHNVANYPLNLEKLEDHLYYNGTKGRKQAILIENIQYNMRQILPIISSIDQRIYLIGIKNLPNSLNMILEKLKNWSNNQKNEEIFQELKYDLKKYKDEYAKKDAEKNNIEIYALLMRLQELLHLMHKVHTLQVQLDLDKFEKLPKAPSKIRFVDQKLALISAFTVFFTVLLTCTIWIFFDSDNINSSSIPMMAAVTCSFFATQDSPLMTLKLFLKYITSSIMIVLVYIVLILPAVNSFETLLIVLIPLFIFLGLLMSKPNTMFIGMVISTSLATLLGLKNQYQANFLVTINGGLATILGISIAIFMMHNLRSRSPKWVANQIEKYALRDIIKTIRNDLVIDRYWQTREELIDGILDKIFHLLPRLKNPHSNHLNEDTNIMQDIRLAVNLLDLKKFSRTEKRPLS